MRRLCMHLRQSGKDNRWHLYLGQRHWKGFDRTSDGEDAGRERGNRVYRRGGESSLVVHRTDGSVELTYTFTRPPSGLDARAREPRLRRIPRAVDACRTRRPSASNEEASP